MFALSNLGGSHMSSAALAQAGSGTSQGLLTLSTSFTTNRQILASGPKIYMLGVQICYFYILITSTS